MIETSSGHSNYRYAAVVLKSLTKSTANRFLAQLDPALSQKIVMEMRQTRVTASNLREAIAKLKIEGIGSPPREDSRVKGTFHRIDNVGSDANYGMQSGLHAQPNLDFSKAQTVQFEKEPFRFLTNQSPEILDRLFDDLQIRSAAVILSTQSFAFASERLKAINGARKVEIMRSIADLEDLHPAEVIDLKFAVQLQVQRMIKSNLTSTAQSTVLSNQMPLNQVVSERSFNASKEVNTVEPHAQKSRRLSLVEQGKLIASLLELPDAQVKKLLKSIDTSCLAPALKMCPITVQKKVLKNMARKPAKFLTNEILSVRVDEKHRIGEARLSIATAIEKLTK